MSGPHKGLGEAEEEEAEEEEEKRCWALDKTERFRPAGSENEKSLRHITGHLWTWDVGSL